MIFPHILNLPPLESFTTFIKTGEKITHKLNDERITRNLLFLPIMQLDDWR
jgi:hypothetical protein